MSEPKRRYAGAGQQKTLARDEVLRYGEFGPDHLLTIYCVAEILVIRLQKVCQIPVGRRIIDKRVYYRKGDIEAWLVEDMAKPDSLLSELRAQHAKSRKRIVMEPSREYKSSMLEKVEKAQAKANNAQLKAKNAAFVWPELSKDELSGGWNKGMVKRRNTPIRAV